jgi:SAM-dependent methyltransferase
LGPIFFCCNVCGAGGEAASIDRLGRETGACRECGATVRLRALAHLVSTRLCGVSLPATAWPHRPGIVGYGVSDWPYFETAFAPRFHYINTQYDPALTGGRTFLDICKPPPELLGTADIVTCSDVLEHVAPPVQRAFDGLFALLKPGGALIFTVPYGLERTVEHFPDLFEWSLHADPSGYMTLRNRTADGRVQEFADLCFHAGSQASLEMRVFGLEDLLEHLRRAGFVDLAIMSQDVLQYGIHFPEPWSLPITAIRPTGDVAAGGRP